MLPSKIAFESRDEHCKRMHKSRSVLYADVARGLHTRPVKTGKRAAAWPVHEGEALAAARMAGLDEEALRALVVKLHAQRASLLSELLGDDHQQPTLPPAASAQNGDKKRASPKRAGR